MPHGLGESADAGVFLARLTRLDAAAVVRLRPAPGGGTALWAALPWRVLVTRALAAAGPRDAAGAALDATVPAAALRDALAAGEPALPARVDTQWRWPLPGGPGRTVERVPVAALAAAAAAAGEALRRTLGQRAVGERVLRDALLDHVTITVNPDKSLDNSDDFAEPSREPVAVPQRLIQAVVRMGFLGALNGVAKRDVDVRVSGTWVGLAARYGTAWLPPTSGFTLNTQFVHTFGHDRLASSVQQWT
ncbi:hypothetical protein [Pilimelia anulata]|uniref:hypothetical protein n=1 Tax=Pilimelia anulata TaxID=53371 RepID=UPI001E659DC0|nr:hypothetical protein [Pilimelia anulata]